MNYGANLLDFLGESRNVLKMSFLGFRGTWWATIGLLGLFTALTIKGISESASVAIGIFVTHLVTLTLLILVGIGYVFFGGGTDTLRANLSDPLTVHKDIVKTPEGRGYAAHVTVLNEAGEIVTAYDAKGNVVEATRVASSEDRHATPEETTPTDPAALAGVEAGSHGGADENAHGEEHGEDGGHSEPKVLKKKTISIATALFFGFAVALLGISGFESSANFVEEQEAGVFPKTLRNMWICVLIFNPAMALLALSLLRVDDIQTNPVYEFGLLAQMGLKAGGGGFFGTALKYLISVDAILVLSGAVLTSFVGVNGLVGRMTLDRCLPQSLLKLSSKGTTYRILLGFFILCLSVHYISKGDIGTLAGVYTISFLAVMALFAVGNILLKVKRDKLPRPVRASWLSVLTAITAVLVGLVANAVREYTYLKMFFVYFVPTMAVVGVMLYRIPLLKLCLGAVRATSAALIKPLRQAAKSVRSKIDEINSQQVVFFTRGDNISNLNNAMRYVMENEDTNRIKVVTVVRDESEIPPKLADDLQFLDEAYPQIDIDYVKRVGKFGPELIQELSKEWKVPTNLMFIGSPGGKLGYGLAELGGVRLII